MSVLECCSIWGARNYRKIVKMKTVPLCNAVVAHEADVFTNIPLWAGDYHLAKQ